MQGPMGLPQMNVPLLSPCPYPQADMELRSEGQLDTPKENYTDSGSSEKKNSRRVKIAQTYTPVPPKGNIVFVRPPPR